MTKLQTLLAVYGAIDELVAQHDERAAATIAAFLPGTTARTERGWFEQIKRLLKGLAPTDNPVEFPDLGAALDGLGKAGTSSADDSDPLTPVQIGRLLYAIAVLSRLPPQNIDRYLFVTDEQLSRVLSLAGPSAGRLHQAGGPQVETERGRELLALFRSEFTDRGDWSTVMASALALDLVTPEIASVGPPCYGSLKRVGARYCTRLTTDATHIGTSVADVKAVIDPLNWPQTLSFFCAMTPLEPTTDVNGWSRVLEEVSTDCSRYRITTALKYWKADVGDGVVINYDLDDRSADTGDTGHVLMDSGYIWVTPSPNGVRVRTSKEILIQGLSPTAVAVFACVLGWADAAREMLFEASLRTLDNPVAWSPSTSDGPFVPYGSRAEVGPPTIDRSTRTQILSESSRVMTDLLHGLTSQDSYRHQNESHRRSEER